MSHYKLRLEYDMEMNNEEYLIVCDALRKDMLGVIWKMFNVDEAEPSLKAIFIEK
jgi:hypothetical protein